jgi:hypothetical protein
MKCNMTRDIIPYYAILFCNVPLQLGTRWRSWLRHCATNRKVAGSIPDIVTGIFHWHNPSGRTMALGSTQHLTEISTRNISWGKGGRCVGLTTLPTSCADCLEIWEPQPPGTLRACPGLLWDCLTFTVTITRNSECVTKRNIVANLSIASPLFCLRNCNTSLTVSLILCPYIFWY